jgi:hypothetical protein
MPRRLPAKWCRFELGRRSSRLSFAGIGRRPDKRGHRTMLPRDHPCGTPTGARMPYISEAQHESIRWIELTELVTRVQATDGCGVEEAREQIRAALRQGAISPLRWEPEPAGPPSTPGRFRIPGNPPPAPNDHWQVIKIDWESSRVFDTFDRAKRKLLLIELRRDCADWELANLHPPRRSAWRRLTLDRGSCESVWPTPQPPNAEQQTPWPADREQMSIKEAAVLLEPCCPPGPLVQRYEAIASERARQLDDARRSTATQRAFLQKIASFNHDFDAWRNASVVDQNENDEPTIAAKIAEAQRQSSLPSYMLLVAQSHGVPLIDPLSGMYTTEPNEEAWIDKDGFEEIWKVLLRHGKRATLPTVFPEPEPERTAIIAGASESAIPTDLVLLARVFECPYTDEFTEHPGLVLTDVIEREFQARRLAVYGRVSPLSTQPVRVPPAYCEINWIGPSEVTDYHPCAGPVPDLMRPGLLNRVQELYYDLAIARDDWQRLLDVAMASLGFQPEPQPVTLINLSVKPKKPRRDEKRSAIIEALKTLVPSDNWEGRSDKERCILVEQHLNKPVGWCKPRTLRRAITEYEKTRL